MRGPLAGLEPPDDTAPAEAIVAWSLERFGRRRLVITTSFGMEGCALIDLFAASGRPLTVWYLDTGFFFPETHQLRDRMIARYPQVTFVDRGTSLSPGQQAELFGDELWRGDPDLCCHLRKVAPLRQALRDADVWVTAITRSQSASRAEARLVEWDSSFQIVKVNPLLHWNRARVWEYIRRHEVPFNPLHERGYPSIGCTHCTHPVKGLGPAEYSRAGRWAGREKTECGLHEPVRLESRR